MVAIQKKAHSLVCECESDETFTQASENLKQYSDKVLDLFKRIHQHRLSARASADRASASANLAAAGGTSLPPSGDRADASNVGNRPRTGVPVSTPDLDDRMAARTTAFTTASPLNAPGNPFCADNASSSVGRHFAPLLIAANLARRKICAAPRVCRPRSAASSPAALAEKRSERHSLRATTGASQSRETSTPRAVRALHLPFPAALAEGRAERPHGVPPPARWDRA